eukprot:1165115-Amphidinium_carterae.1
MTPQEWPVVGAESTPCFASISHCHVYRYMPEMSLRCGEMGAVSIEEVLQPLARMQIQVKTMNFMKCSRKGALSLIWVTTLRTASWSFGPLLDYRAEEQPPSWSEYSRLVTSWARRLRSMLISLAAEVLTTPFLLLRGMSRDPSLRRATDFGAPRTCCAQCGHTHPTSQQ